MSLVSAKSLAPELEYALRIRVLKLRWMGLENEAEELIATLGYRDAPPKGASERKLPRMPVSTD